MTSTHGPRAHSLSFWSWLGVLLVLAVAALIPLACTEAGLEEIPPEPLFRDDKLEMSGGICTREPETLVFPLRVLFVVDASVSMEVTDPPDPVTGETGRERAVRETWEGLLEDGPEGVRIGIVRFSAQAQSRTGTDLDGDGVPDTYFTADRTLLMAATQSLGVTDRTTNYSNALGEAYFEIRTELMAADLESLPLSKYVVVFLSDGIPDTDDENTRGNANSEIQESVRAIEELAKTFRVGGFSFHTAYVSSGQGAAFDQLASDLLEDMADEGEGTFRSFPNGEEINFLFVDFSVLKRVFTLKSLVAINTNSVIDHTQVPPQPVLMDAELTWADGEPSGVLGLDVQLARASPGTGDAVWVAVLADWPPASCASDPCPDGQLCASGGFCAWAPSPKVVVPVEQIPVHAEIPDIPEADHIIAVCYDVGGELVNDPGLSCDGADDKLAFYRGGCPITLTAGVELGPDAFVVVEEDERTGEVRFRRVIDPSTFVDLNGNEVPDCGEPLVDTDGDGLADLAELHIGRYVRNDALRCERLSDPLVPDTDDDGLTDRLEWEFLGSGLHPRIRDDSCYVPNVCIDQDDDGLCACLLDADYDPTSPTENDLGNCDCMADENVDCVNEQGYDCVDETSLEVGEEGPDGFCDCPDVNLDGRCDYKDTDGDGLHDCEELVFGTAQRGTDSEADGLPDPVEVRFLTNPAEIDAEEDFDFDRTVNAVEVAGGTNPQCDDASLRSRVAYRYQLDDLGLRGAVVDQLIGTGDGVTTAFDLSSTETRTHEFYVDGNLQAPGDFSIDQASGSGGVDQVVFLAPPEAGAVLLANYDLVGTQSCYGFNISNITLVPTLARNATLDPRVEGPYPGDGWNRILIYAGEVAFDDPQSFASYRIACIMASYSPFGGYRNPPSGSVSLTEADFIEVSDFDPNQHCRTP